MDVRSIRSKLIRWYKRAQRDLPWRRTRDPYAIWISEIMLQQTRVAAVIPYYERFLARFPNPSTLARAPEEEVLALWSGLGYYSRARNLQKAARQIETAGAFPAKHGEILSLAGVGDYTAAAIASISFGLPFAVVDGNVRRVIARVLNQSDADVQAAADRLLDRRDPARWNQALMELGALVCLPREPRCGECPLAAECGARAQGTQREIPGKKRKPATERLSKTLLVIRRGGKILLAPSSRVKGFWDLPEPFRGAHPGKVTGKYTHTITHRHYTFTVRAATLRTSSTHTATGRAAAPDHRGSRRANPHRASLYHWFDECKLGQINLSTISKKALTKAGVASPRMIKSPRAS